MNSKLIVMVFWAALIWSPLGWSEAEDAEPVVEESTEELLITSDGKTLTIRVDEEGEDGETFNLEIDLKDGFSGAAAQKVIEHLKANGIVDGDSFKLTEDDFEDLDEHEVNIDIDHGGNGGLIPIIAILSVFGAPVLIVYLVVRSSTRRKQMFHETVCKLAESGKELPEGLLERLEGGDGGNIQQKAAKLIALGVAISLSLFFIDGIETASLGLIPLLIGVSQLWVWKTQQDQAR